MSPADLERLAAIRRLLGDGEAQRIREHARLSRRELAAAVGVSREAVQKWELGDRVPSGSAALRYARVIERLASLEETHGAA